ncbi:hypothetical protein NLG97_g685 [Lecanicillium saksenae]|uniref:Uncharacterized protein n=1 Tax=Lecanicillium saksenae TaxID=468837 RepID=A0ACC1R5U0_9HYPO|nr:hypothetical protein NLG97_g685 [Lecanicillium saksenae]
MPSDKQGESYQQNQASQAKQEDTRATTSYQLPSRPKNTTTPATMPKNSGGSMAHGSLALRQPSAQYQASTTPRHNRQTSQGDAADLFAVGAWADAQMGGADLDDDFDQHLRSTSDKQSPRR